MGGFDGSASNCCALGSKLRGLSSGISAGAGGDGYASVLGDGVLCCVVLHDLFTISAFSLFFS